MLTNILKRNNPNVGFSVAKINLAKDSGLEYLFAFEIDKSYSTNVSAIDNYTYSKI